MKFSQITNNKELLFLLKTLYSNYQGYKFSCNVVSIDQLKNIKPTKHQIIIVNYSKENQPGTHWVLIANIDEKYVEYFDSFGIPNPPNPILNFMKGYKKEAIANNKQIQKVKESDCGWMIMYYLKLRIQKSEMPAYAIEHINDKDVLAYGKMLTKKYEKFIQSSS